MSDRGGFPGRPGVPALPPSGVPSLPPGLLAPQPVGGVTPPSAPVAAPAAAPQPSQQPAPVPAPAAAPRPPAAEARPRRAASSLAPTFAGRPASAGVRLAAFSIDVVAVSIVVTAVFFATSSAVFAALAALELAVGLWVVESRTGITVGNALLRVRTSRDDAPFSPGVGRGFVRWIITGAGFLVGWIGAWVVVASSAWDASGLGRTWADRAAKTVVVSMPKRSRVSAAEVVRADPVVLQAPHLVSTSARGAAVDDDSASVSFTGAPGATPIATEAASVRGAIAASQPAASQLPAAPAQPVAPAVPSVASEPQQPASAPQQGRRAAGVPVVAEQPPVAAPVAEPASEGALLLIFDTGQREQLPAPVAVNLGRNPSVTDQGDRLITVRDPESTVSKTHLRLEHSRGRTWVTDNGSTNGTEIRSDDGDSAPLLPGNRVLLDEGDRIRIGNRTFTVSLLVAHDNAAGERA